MSTIFRGKGKALTLVAPSGGVTSNEVVLAGTIVGVVAADAAEGEEFALDIHGEFELPCASADVIAIGDSLYWTGTELTKTATDNDFAGRAHSAAGAGVTSVICCLQGGA